MKKCWDIVKYPDRVICPPYTMIEEIYLVTEEHHFMIVPDLYSLHNDADDNTLKQYEFVADDYRGLCFEVNDHGNITLWYKFKNGNRREIWSCV